MIEERHAVLGVVPARGGSKGVPLKNLRTVGDVSLVGRAIDCGLGAAGVDDLVVSTDHAVIADVARDRGVPVIPREAHLAGDEITALEVVRDVLHRARDLFGHDFTALVLLQPTSPFRTAAHVQAALEQFHSSNVDTVVSVQHVPHQFTPGSLMVRNGDRLTPAAPLEGGPRRQDKASFVARNGPAILVTRSSVVDAGRLYGEEIGGFTMTALESIDIDDEADLELANAVCAAGLAGGRP